MIPILLGIIVLIIVTIVTFAPEKKYVVTYREEFIDDRFIVVFETVGILGIHGEKIEFINYDDEWDKHCIEKALLDSKLSHIPYEGPKYF